MRCERVHVAALLCAADGQLRHGFAGWEGVGRGDKGVEIASSSNIYSQAMYKFMLHPAVYIYSNTSMCTYVVECINVCMYICGLCSFGSNGLCLSQRHSTCGRFVGARSTETLTRQRQAVILCGASCVGARETLSTHHSQQRVSCVHADGVVELSCLGRQT